MQQPDSDKNGAASYADWSYLGSQQQDTQPSDEYVYDDDDTCSEQAGQCDGKPYLDRFSFLTHAEIHQLTPTHYKVLGDSGLAFLYARIRHPSSGCCGSTKNNGFTIDFSDISSRQTVMKLICDEHNAVTVESPPKEVIGYVSVERVLCSLRFTVRDAHGTSRLLVRMPKFCKAGCKRHWFQILLPDESAEVATIGRRVDQAVEVETRAPVYSLLVGEMMSTDMKAILIGVMLLFDRKQFA